MTAVLPDLEEVTFPEIPILCEAIWRDKADVEHKCQRAAEWVVHTRCQCGHVEIDLLCDYHWQLISFVRSEPGQEWRFSCMRCGRRGERIEFHGEPL